MKHGIFTIYDEKAQAYFPPFFLHQTAMAVRQFANMANDSNTTIGTNPEDYYLFEVGEFDDSDGSIEQYPTRKGLGCALEYVKVDVDEDQMVLKLEA